MSVNTKIEWCDATWSPITGCTPISEGCQNCYAKRMANRLRGRCGYPVDDPFRVTFHPDRLEQLIKWKKPKRVFVVSMGDLFHENVKDEWLDHIFAVMGRCQQHTFLLLTKRPERMAKYLLSNRYNQILKVAYSLNFRPEGMGLGISSPSDLRWWPHVWIGVTAENQQRADERIPVLLQIPATKRFVSVEPMLSEINLREIRVSPTAYIDSLAGKYCCPLGEQNHNSLSLVIAGGETGPGARPMQSNWARLLRDQCKDAEVPFFFKQMANKAPIPGDLTIREWPE